VEVFTLRIPHAQLSAARRVARARGLTVSAWIRLAEQEKRERDGELTNDGQPEPFGNGRG
jgi:hypothetical protein